jgi:hypothetical protein
MDKTQEIANRMWDLMEEREYPTSVMQTVMGALDWSETPLKTAMEIEPILLAAESPRQLVKNLQPIIRML